MTRVKVTGAFEVGRRGGPARTVIGRDWLDALSIVLAEEGVVDTLSEMSIKVAASGVVARCGARVWMVRPHASQSTHRALRPLDGVSSTRVACERALMAARDAVPCESGAVLLLEREYLRFVAVAGPHAQSLLGVRLSGASGVVGYAVQAQRAVLVGDAASHPRHFGALDAITGHETRQIVAVPVAAAGAVYGVIELMNAPDERSFSRSDVARLEGIAEVLATFLTRRPKAI